MLNYSPPPFSLNKLHSKPPSSQAQLNRLANYSETRKLPEILTKYRTSLSILPSLSIPAHPLHSTGIKHYNSPLPLPTLQLPSSPLPSSNAKKPEYSNPITILNGSYYVSSPVISVGSEL